jgi:hypothetical protein
MTPVERAAYLDQLITNLQAEVADITKGLETRLVDLIRGITDVNSVRFTITQMFEQYKGLLNSALSEISTIDADAQSNTVYLDLRRAATDTVIKDFDSAALEIIALLTIGSAAGTPSTQLIKQARARVSGIWLTSSDPVIVKNQRLLGKLFENTGANSAEIALAQSVIKDRLRGVNTTLSLRDLTSKTVESAVMEFDGAWTYHKAKTAGVKRWRYEGGLIDTSREFCAEHQGNIYSEEEIRKLWDNNTWGGKKPGNPFVVRGGWRCRHFWEPIQD